MSLFYSSISSWCYIHSFFSSCYVYFSIWDYSFCLTATLLNFYLYHLSTFLAHVNSPCLVWSFAVVVLIDFRITYVDIVMRTEYFLNPLNHRYCYLPPLSFVSQQANRNFKNKSTISSMIFFLLILATCSQNLFSLFLQPVHQTRIQCLL